MQKKDYRPQGGVLDCGGGIMAAREGPLVTLTGLPLVDSIKCDLEKGSYKIEFSDGDTATGENESWDSKTTVRYALLAYRNRLNAAINAALFQERRERAQRASRIEQLLEAQRQQEAVLLALAKKLGVAQ